MSTRRFWTDAEVAYLRRHYHRQPAAVIAQALGRTVKAVHQAAAQHGLGARANRLSPAGQRRLRTLAAEGACNRCIGRLVHLNRQGVRRWRRKLGLPPVPSRGMLASCRRCVDAVRAKTAAQCRRAGVASLAEVRALAFRRRAIAAGWPADLRPRAVEILDLLWARGPLTRRELCAALGLPHEGRASRRLLKSNDPEGSYLAHLMARGLVVPLGRLYRGGYRYEVVYSLSLLAQKEVPGEPHE